MAEKENVPVEKLDKRLAKMAISLLGATCVRNLVGWAPATHVKHHGTEIFALPGPPNEVKGFFDQYVSKILASKTGRKSLSARFVVTMYEEELSTIANQVTTSQPDVYIKPIVSAYKPELGLPLEILVFGQSENECRRRMERVVHRFSRLVTAKGKLLKPASKTHPTFPLVT